MNLDATTPMEEFLSQLPIEFFEARLLQLSLCNDIMMLMYKKYGARAIWTVDHTAIVQITDRFVPITSRAVIKLGMSETHIIFIVELNGKPEDIAAFKTTFQSAQSYMSDGDDPDFKALAEVVTMLEMVAAVASKMHDHTTDQLEVVCRDIERNYAYENEHVIPLDQVIRSDKIINNQEDGAYCKQVKEVHQLDAVLLRVTFSDGSIDNRVVLPSEATQNLKASCWLSYVPSAHQYMVLQQSALN